MNNNFNPNGQTMVPGEQTIASTSQTLAAASQTFASESTHVSGAPVNLQDIPQYDVYTINGIDYEFVSVISKSSGEADVFRVKNNGKDYALKIYRGNRHPNHTVLETIKNLQGSGLLVDIYDHGIWCDHDGFQYDFELMAYCYGRPLNAIKLNDNEEKFREIAVKIAATVDFCHKHHILHRDIKPSNFIFADKEETNLVITDFGIGKMLDSNNTTTTDDGRTPIYAAPEMYTHIPGRPTYITPASDFYSMGMTLLAIWIGEGMLTADERKLVRDKQEETLPYPTAKISTQTVSLIKGLTRRNPEQRLSYDDIARWARGEVVYVEQKDSVRGDFRVVFSSKNNQIAHSAEELAKMLWENQEMAKQYLYKEQVEKWFREMDLPEYALQINAITEDLYPDNRDAGLYATCLLLDPETPYFGLDGKGITSYEDIAKELFDNTETYASSLKDSKHNLWLYLEHCGEGELVAKYRDIILKRDKYGVSQFCYELNPDMPYRIYRDNSTPMLISNFDHLFRYIHNHDINDKNIHRLDSHDFMTWLRQRSSQFEANVINNLNDNPEVEGASRGWLIAYSIGLTVDYDFTPIDKNYNAALATIEDIAYEIANEINGKSDRYSLAYQICYLDFTQTRLYQYLYTRKKYSKHIEWIVNCMNLHTEENENKYGHYTIPMAQMKTVSGLINGGFPLEIGGYKISNLSEYEANKTAIDMAVQSDSAKAQLLEYWTALSFQENVNCDYTKESYFSLVLKYLDYIKFSFPKSTTAQNANKTKSDLSAAKMKFDKQCSKIKTIQLLTIFLCYVPLITASVFGIIGIYNIEDSIFENIMEVVGSVLGIIVGIAALCLAAAAGGGCIGGVIAGVIAGWLTLALCTLITPVVPWLFIAIIIAILVYFGIKIFAKRLSKPEDKWSQMDLDTAGKLACIGDAFGTRDKVLPALPEDYPVCVYKGSSNKLGNSIRSIGIHALIMFLLTAITCAILIWTHSTL